ncbi:Vps36-domain-containing protein, partial [Tothia fuscella]
KYKIPQFQHGQAYLTSHRVCWLDNEDPRKHSVAIDLKDIDRPELYAGFLSSSPKITLYSKINKHGVSSLQQKSPYSPSSTPTRRQSQTRPIAPTPTLGPNATWVCPICSFSNPIPPNFDPATANANTKIPKCQSCGIPPPMVLVVKAALAAMSNRQAKPESPAPAGPIETQSFGTFRCTRCTFENHPSLLVCEMCGASLVTAADKRLEVERGDLDRAESPGPVLKELNLNDDKIESVKLSFRGGGEKIFFERLKGAMVQRKWLLQSAPPIPRPTDSKRATSPRESFERRPSDNLVGIAGLERRGQALRESNQLIIGNAFEDLEALMTSAKEVIALAERFSSQTADGDGGSSEANAVVSALGLTTTKDMLGSDTLYISELSRNLAEFLTDDTKGVLRKEGGIMSLVDLWQVFNRARGGVELVSPADFSKAAEMWDKLKLPVRLRRFKSGLLVVQGRDRTDDKTIASILAWLKDLHFDPPRAEVRWDWTLYGRGVTAQETAQRFGWSVGVASEELEMAEEKGALCREQGLDGLRFWENWIVNMPALMI